MGHKKFFAPHSPVRACPVQIFEGAFQVCAPPPKIFEGARRPAGGVHNRADATRKSETRGQNFFEAPLLNAPGLKKFFAALFDPACRECTHVERAPLRWQDWLRARRKQMYPN